MMRQIPGNVTSHHDEKMTVLASLRILPRLGAGSGIPQERKLSAASTSIELAKIYVACTMTGDKTFGIMWRKRILGHLAPILLIASIYVCSRTCSATPRVTVTTSGMYTIDILIITFLVLIPSIVISVIAMRNTGIVDIASLILIIIVSSQLKYPASSPNIIPITVDITAVRIPTTSDILIP